MVEIASYGPWAVVTGASSGLGRAFAGQLAAAGLNLVLAARSTDRLDELGAALAREHGISYRVHTVDLAEPGAATGLVDATAGLDVGLLVSNAGAGRPGSFLDQPLAELRQRLVLNAASHLDLVHPFAQRFAARGRGGIVLVSAYGARDGLPYMAHDAAAKAYVLSLGEALHRELGRAGIDVTVLLPGNVDTPVLAKLGVEPGDLPTKPMSAEDAVRESLAAFLRGRSTHTPGRILRLVSRIAPRSARIRMGERMASRGARNLAARDQATLA